MLTIPEYSSPYARILGIDPGTETLGAASIEYNVLTGEIHGAEAKTFKGSKLISSDWVEEYHGSRFARIQAHSSNLARILGIIEPSDVAVESPFFSHLRPQAYGALTEIVYAIKLTVFSYDPTLPFVLIDPPSVKNSVGAKGNADKDAVREKVLAILSARYSGRISIDRLDEHSIDSLAVAYACYLSRVKLMFPVLPIN
jgi:Holliday junction resolvasome RuvABC endonuclease subunit